MTTIGDMIRDAVANAALENLDAVTVVQDLLGAMEDRPVSRHYAQMMIWFHTLPKVSEDKTECPQLSLPTC